MATEKTLIPRAAVVSWSTKKTGDSFEFSVYLVKYQEETRILKKRGGYKTRPNAKFRAQRWVRYFKQCQGLGITV